MSVGKRPVTPAVPESMEVLFVYRCPYCRRQVALVAPLQPALAQCDACGKAFPIVPVDERSVQFIKLMLDNGKAAADGDFL